MGVRLETEAQRGCIAASDNMAASVSSRAADVSVDAVPRRDYYAVNDLRRHAGAGCPASAGPVA